MDSKDKGTSIGLEVEEVDLKVVEDSRSNLVPMVLHNMDQDKVEGTSDSTSQIGTRIVKRPSQSGEG